MIALITPALAKANTGNWHTAARWARFLRPRARVHMAQHWSVPEEPAKAPDMMIALHARRCADSIAAYAQAYPDRPLIVVLTGTDLYRDIAQDQSAQHSLRCATHLVVLNELGARALPARYRAKTVVIVQSAPALKPKPRSHLGSMLRVVAVGHLRDEKDPRLVMRCARALKENPQIQIRHIGLALDSRLGKQARATERACPSYRWLGGLTRAQARQQMRRADLLLHPSKMEGGAQVVIEAIRAGTPVIASAIDGNQGLLGVGYPGLFALGDVAACVRLIERAAREPRFYEVLQKACRARAPLFDPKKESRALNRLVFSALREVIA